MRTATSKPNVLRLLAPAKINLHLRVGPRRNDGFHPLLTWMTTIGFFDNLTLTGYAGSLRDEHGIAMTCSDPALPCDARNLVYQAAAAFGECIAKISSPMQSQTPCTLDVAIHLEKHIPAGGGLGGGSSDAARMLLGLNQLWHADLDIEQLNGMSANLGSDVPFFLFGTSSICKGRGDAVRPIGRGAGDPWVTLVLPPMGLPTADVYRRFDQMGLGRERDIAAEPQWSEWTSLDARSLLPQLVNDLEPPAFSLRPDLGELRAGIEQSRGRPVRMSGSGSSLFTLYDDKDEAKAAASHITSTHGVRALAFPLAPIIEDDLTDQ